jgi:hypothetical protein
LALGNTLVLEQVIVDIKTGLLHKVGVVVELNPVLGDSDHIGLIMAEIVEVVAENVLVPLILADDNPLLSEGCEGTVGVVHGEGLMDPTLIQVLGYQAVIRDLLLAMVVMSFLEELFLYLLSLVGRDEFPVGRGVVVGVGIVESDQGSSDVLFLLQNIRHYHIRLETLRVQFNARLGQLHCILVKFKLHKGLGLFL